MYIYIYIADKTNNNGNKLEAGAPAARRPPDRAPVMPASVRGNDNNVMMIILVIVIVIVIVIMIQ